MSGGKDKLPVVPTSSMKVQVKGKIALAQKGHSMLQRKAKALTMKLEKLRTERQKEMEELVPKLKIAYTSLARAFYCGFDLRSIYSGREETAQIVIKIQMEKVSGVNLPKFKLIERSGQAYAAAGIDRAGRHILQVKNNFLDVLKCLVQLASFTYGCQELDLAVKKLNQRVNAIEYMIIPRLMNTLVYIDTELDEVEREEFFRLKRAIKGERDEIPDDIRDNGEEHENFFWLKQEEGE